jgi:hypothetical protein
MKPCPTCPWLAARELSTGRPPARTTPPARLHPCLLRLLTCRVRNRQAVTSLQRNAIPAFNGNRAADANRTHEDPGASVVRLAGLEPPTVTTCNDKDLQNQAKTGGAESGALSADLPPDVADLARRLAALPKDVRAALLTTIRAADAATKEAAAAGGHEHKAKSSRRQSWGGCVTPDMCMLESEREMAHGGLTMVERCACGAVRVTETNGNASNSTGWRMA